MGQPRGSTPSPAGADAAANAGRINGLLILLFLAVAGFVYVIYAQMHRDATLSHLTKTTPGELGADFWIRILGIGAVPILSLLAAFAASVADLSSSIT